MKKLIFATTLLFSTVAHMVCTTDNMNSTHMATLVVDNAKFTKNDGDDKMDEIAPLGIDKANLGQADYSGNGSGH